MPTTNSSKKSQPGRSQETGNLRGLIVATKMHEHDDERPYALLRVGGISLLERQVRLLRNLGVGEIVVLAAGGAGRLRAEIERLAKLHVHIVLCMVGQDLAGALPVSRGESWLLVDGSALVDFRLPMILAKQETEYITLAPLKRLPPEDAARGIRVEASEFPAVFAGCARLSSERLEHVQPAKGDDWLGDLLSKMIQDGTGVAVDISALPTYLPSMRRDLSYYWIPIRDAEDRRRGKEVLIASAQKGVLDWPAVYIHRPIENWLTRYICEWPITPNQLTLIGNIVAYFGAYNFAVGSLGWAMLSALSVGVLDGLDGLQARVKQMTSRFGGTFEHLCDSIYEYVWQFAIAYRLMTEGHGTTPYVLACIIVGVDMANKVMLHIFERRRGVPLDDFSPFDRGFRVVVGRRDNYMWTLLPFVVFGALHIGFWVIAAYALITLLERMWRVSFNLLCHPKPIPGTLKIHRQSP